ncbi:MAG: hypothetical protein G01um101470_995, partial [Parcubacteria group bacterium Gr01-1014_70]
MFISYYEKTKEYFRHYERHLSSAGLIVGFVVDNLTLKRIDLLFENLVLFSYLAVAGVGIFFVNMREEGRLRNKFFEEIHEFLPVIVQFAFGNLFSGLFVFYSRGSSFSHNWPFIVLLLGLLIGNEFFKERYMRLTFHVSVFFVALFSFFIFFVPVVAGAMGVWVFLVSGAAALVITGGFIL